MKRISYIVPCIWYACSVLYGIHDGVVSIQSIKNNTTLPVLVEIPHQDKKNPFADTAIKIAPKKMYSTLIEVGSLSLNRNALSIKPTLYTLPFNIYPDKKTIRQKLSGKSLEKVSAFEIHSIQLTYKKLHGKDSLVPHIEVQWSETSPMTVAKNKTIASYVRKESCMIHNYEPQLHNDEDIRIMIQINPSSLHFEAYVVRISEQPLMPTKVS